MDKKFYEEYQQWRVVKKKGKKSYFVSNVLVTSLFSTAIFAIALGILDLIIQNKSFDFIKIIIYSLIFIIVNTLVLFLFYNYTWTKNISRFDSYEKELKEQIREKFNAGEITEEQMTSSNVFELLNDEDLNKVFIQKTDNDNNDILR